MAGSSNMNSFMDSRNHGVAHEEVAQARVNEGKGQYGLRAQHSKRVFSDAEIQQFKLKRRNETPEIRFDVD